MCVSEKQLSYLDSGNGDVTTEGDIWGRKNEWNTDPASRILTTTRNSDYLMKWFFIISV